MPKAQRMTMQHRYATVSSGYLQIWLGSLPNGQRPVCPSAISNVLGKRAAGRVAGRYCRRSSCRRGLAAHRKGSSWCRRGQPSVTGICLPKRWNSCRDRCSRITTFYIRTVSPRPDQLSAVRYWFCVPDDSPWIADPELKIEPGDQLLIETNQTYWESRKTNSRRQPCVVCLEDKKQALPAYVPQGEDDPRLYDIPLPGPAPECARGLRPLSLGPEVPEDSFDAANGSRMPTPPNIQTVGVAVDLTRHFASWNVP